MRAPRGFAVVELGAALVVVVLLFILAALFTTDSRRRTMLAGSIQNLQQFGHAAGAFASDNQNRIFSLSWEPGPHTCGDYVFPNSASYWEAGAHQAICILRDRAGRTDFVAQANWLPQLYYSHLVLIDYLDGKLPTEIAVSPGDAPRQAWRRSINQVPGDPAAGFFNVPCRPAGTGPNMSRWQYSSSYELQPSMYTPDAITFPPNGGSVTTMAQDPQGHRYFQPGTNATVYGARRFDEIRHPANKAMMYETAQRFFGTRETFALHIESRVPILLSDGAADVRSTRHSNPGFFPNTPTSFGPTRVHYIPELSWEPPTVQGAPSEFVNGQFRWTRSGLRGRDFLGPEIPWEP